MFFIEMKDAEFFYQRLIFWVGWLCSDLPVECIYRLTASFCRCGYFYFERSEKMESRIALMAIIVENIDSTERLNGILHEYGEYIIGRMGLPYRKCNLSIVSVAVDAPQDIISTMSGKIGKLDGVSVKIAYSKVVTNGE